MRLDEWTKLEQLTIKGFEENWKEMNKVNPEQFPLEMSHGEWYEQYIAYCELFDCHPFK